MENMNGGQRREKKKYSVVSGIKAGIAGLLIGSVTPTPDFLVPHAETTKAPVSTAQDTVNRVQMDRINAGVIQSIKKKEKWNALSISQNIEDRRGQTGGEDISKMETLPPIQEVTVKGFDQATINAAGRRGINSPQLGSIE